MNRPVKGVFFGATVLLALGSVVTLLLLDHGQVDKKCSEEVITHLGELQLLLFVAFLALLPQSHDIRTTLSCSLLRLVFIVLVVVALLAPAYAMVGYFDSGDAAHALGILVCVTLVANAALVLDAIQDQGGTPPPTISQIGTEVDRVLTARARAAAAGTPAKKRWRVSLDGWGIKIEEQ